MLVFYIILAAVVIGLGVALTVLHKMHWTVFAITAAVSLLVPWPVQAITLAIAKTDQQTFHEYWNGFETNTYQRDTTCVRDGSCVHTYDCDPYVVMETEYYTEYHTEYYTDSEGRSQSRQVGVQKSRQVPKTKYHSCPYSSQETSYYVDSTLKNFTIASNLMTGEPYRWGVPIPGGQITAAPILWTQAKERIEAGNPGPVSTVNSYRNYLLNSKDSLFKRYSDLIEELKAEGTLPPITSGVESLYHANKLHVVGDIQGIDKLNFQQDVAKLNGAVGTELRGDLHVVMIDAEKVSASREDYTNALLGYWQSKEEFGRDALGKNAIVLVIAVEPYEAAPVTTPAPEATATPTPEATAAPEVEIEKAPIAVGTPVVKWASAFTGMPVGNEGLIQQVASQLPGTPIYQNFFGNPKYDIASEKVLHSEGVIEGILWGPNQFERVSMEAKDADDVGSGFSYLSDEWQPDPGTMTLIYILGGILAALALAGGAFASIAMRDNGTTDFVRYLFTKH